MGRALLVLGVVGYWLYPGRETRARHSHAAAIAEAAGKPGKTFTVGG